MNGVLRIGQAAALLQVSTKSIRRWDKAGKICCFRTPGGHRRIALTEIKRIKTGQPISKISIQSAIYARVSSHDQKKKGDLQRQIEISKQYCESKGLINPHVFQDTASGLNTKRRGFLKLCQAIELGKVNHIVLTYPDRLTRFGFQYLERYFGSYGANIEVINQSIDLSLEQELVQDLISIVTSFSGRVHGLRSARARKRRQEIGSLKK